MSKRSANLYLNQKLVAAARAMMRSEGFDSLSTYIEHLIREEHKKHFGTPKLQETAPEYQAKSSSPADQVSDAAAGLALQHIHETKPRSPARKHPTKSKSP